MDDDEVAFDIGLETYNNLMMLREFTGDEIDVLVHKAVVLYLQTWFRNDEEIGDE